MPLQGDADLMTVLLRNLLDNAVRYAPEGSTVRLRFGADRLAIENDGAALPPDVLAQLGQRFSPRRRPGRKRQRPGVLIVQRIAALHGLTLRYGTQADGQGVVAESCQVLSSIIHRHSRTGQVVPCPDREAGGSPAQAVVSPISVSNQIPMSSKLSLLMAAASVAVAGAPLMTVRPPLDATFILRSVGVDR